MEDWKSELITMDKGFLHEEGVKPKGFYRSRVPLIALSSYPDNPEPQDGTRLARIDQFVGCQAFVVRATVEKYKRAIRKKGLRGIEAVRATPMESGKLFVTNGFHRIEAIRALDRVMVPYRVW